MATRANSSKTVRFMLFVLLFMAVVLFFVFLVVIPSVKTFKSKKAAYLSQQRQQIELTRKKEELQKRLERVTKRYAGALDAFRNDFDEKAFLEMARRYFHNVTLRRDSEKKSESGLQIYAFKADFDAKTPVQFYRFVDALQKMRHVVKINFPIVLDAQGKRIHLQFNMSVYRLQNAKQEPHKD